VLRHTDKLKPLDDEIAGAQRHGYQSITLGPRVLRAESAALVAISICQALWGDI